MQEISKALDAKFKLRIKLTPRHQIPCAWKTEQLTVGLTGGAKNSSNAVSWGANEVFELFINQ